MLLPSLALLLYPPLDSMPSTNAVTVLERRQREIADADDPFLADLSRGIQCCFAGIPHAKEQERQQNFLQSAQTTKKLHIAIPSNGLNLHLNLVHSVVQEQNEVHFLSEFFLNGSLVRLKGHINSRTLAGNAQIERVHQPSDATPTANAEMNIRERRERIERRLAHLREIALRL